MLVVTNFLYNGIRERERGREREKERERKRERERERDKRETYTNMQSSNQSTTVLQTQAKYNVTCTLTTCALLRTYLDHHSLQSVALGL